MKIIKGENLKYGINADFPYKWLIGLGIFVIIVSIIGFINVLLTDGFILKTLLSVIFFIFISVLLILLGIKGKSEIKMYVDKFLYIKENGFKAEGKIIKGYSYTVIKSNHNYNCFQLKVTFYDESIEKNGTFITPLILGNIDKICSDIIDVYYFNGEAVIDNLKNDDFSVEFKEGVHQGSPYTDNPEWEAVKTMELKDMIKKTNELRKKAKKESKKINYAVMYED